jgi:hypothetical protein
VSTTSRQLLICGFSVRFRGGSPLFHQHRFCTHTGAIVAADFFTTEVWTSRGLVFTIELQSRRVRIHGSTTTRVFLCDRDRKWTTAVGQIDASGWRFRHQHLIPVSAWGAITLAMIPSLSADPFEEVRLIHRRAWRWNIPTADKVLSVGQQRCSVREASRLSKYSRTILCYVQVSFVCCA